MRVTITLCDPAGVAIVARTVAIVDLCRLSSGVGQEAWDMFSAAGHKGVSPIGLTLTVAEAEESDATDAVQRAASIVASGRKAFERRRR